MPRCVQPTNIASSSAKLKGSFRQLLYSIMTAALKTRICACTAHQHRCRQLPCETSFSQLHSIHMLLHCSIAMCRGTHLHARFICAYCSAVRKSFRQRCYSVMHDSCMQCTCCHTAQYIIVLLHNMQCAVQQVSPALSSKKQFVRQFVSSFKHDSCVQVMHCHDAWYTVVMQCMYGAVEKTHTALLLTNSLLKLYHAVSCVFESLFKDGAAASYCSHPVMTMMSL